MEDNKINYESTSDDNTSEENVGKVVKTRKASSKYKNPYGKQKQPLIPNRTIIESNKNNEPKNVSNDIRKIIKVSNPTLLLIKGRR